MDCSEECRLEHVPLGHDAILLDLENDNNSSTSDIVDVCNKIEEDPESNRSEMDVNFSADQRTNASEKQDHCNREVCDKQFTGNEGISTHPLSRTKEKPYHCTICEKSAQIDLSMVSYFFINTISNEKSTNETEKLAGCAARVFVTIHVPLATEIEGQNHSLVYGKLVKITPLTIGNVNKSTIFQANLWEMGQIWPKASFGIKEMVQQPNWPISVENIPFLTRYHTIVVNQLLTYWITLRPRQNGCHFPDDIFKYIFLNKNVLISITIFDVKMISQMHFLKWKCVNFDYDLDVKTIPKFDRTLTAMKVGPTLAQRRYCRRDVGPTLAQPTLLSGEVSCRGTCQISEEEETIPRVFEISRDLTIRRLTPWTKWPPFHRRYFQNAFSWTKHFEFWLKYSWSLFLKVQLTMSQQCMV